MRRVMVGAVLVALVLSGCEIRAEIEVEEDGSGTIGMVFAMEALFFGSMPSGLDPLAQARRDLADDPIPWKVEDYVSNGMKGFRATAPFDSIEHLREMIDEQARADGETPFDPNAFVIERDGAGGWRFEMTSEAPGQELAGSLSPFGEDFGESPSFGADFGDPSLDFEGELGFTPEVPGLPAGADNVLRFEFHVTLPGDAAEHNAPDVEQKGGRSTFVWRYNLSDVDPVALRAATTPAGASLPLMPIAAVLLVLGGGVAFVRRRRGTFVGTLPPVVLEGLPPMEYTPAERAPVRASVQASVQASVAPEQPSLLAELGDD